MAIEGAGAVSTSDGQTGGASNTLSLIRPEEVILISKRPQSPDSYEICSLKEDTVEQVTSYKLSQVQTVDVPQSLLDQFLIQDIPEHLQSGQSRQIHVVVSTGSGTGLASNFYDSVLRPLLESLGFSVSEAGTGANTFSLIITQNAESIRDFARNLGHDNRDGSKDSTQHTIILLSGDGGVIEILNGKAPADSSETKPHLPLIAMLPLGTGNALFHSLHKSVETGKGLPAPSSLVQALRTLFTGRAAPLPSFKADFPPGSRTITYTSAGKPGADSASDLDGHADAVSYLYGAIVASYGFHSQLVWESDTPEYRKYGAKRFGMIAEQLLKESHAYKAVVELVGKDDSRTQKLDRNRHAYILATMVSNLEKTFAISPASRPFDGKLRLVHFGAVSGAKTMEIMMKAYDGGKHVDMQWTGADGKEERVGYEEAGEIRITTLEEDARWRKVCIDGTIVELPQDGCMTVRTEEKAHLQVLVDLSVI
ncbi:ATP-NAD kinase-like domain-containing protein [Xylariaceae sp. FL0662B]|nr:ATP-NAD kinase-like domain-containing protein [Xylariaceae sp. FL0662B]